MRHFLLAVAGATAVALLATACSDESETQEPTEAATATAPAEPVDATSTAAATTTAAAEDPVAGSGDILAALIAIDNAGFHGMDEALNGTAPAIEASWLGATQRARTAAAALRWPAGLEAAAGAFVAAADGLEEALEADDAAGAGPLATAAHETQHELSHQAYAAVEAAPASASDAGSLLAALWYVDNAGFHGMEETLNGASPVIDAGWVGDTTRARVAAQAVAWPADLQAAVDAFVEAATALEGALEADDAEGAAPLAAQTHEAQHELSHQAYEALPQLAAADTTGAQLAALWFMDNAGFHDMDETLNGSAPAIDASWLGATERARSAAQAVAWPEDVQPAADAFVEAATALEAALEADDAAGAGPLATAAHDTEHELSHQAYAHLGGGDENGH